MVQKIKSLKVGKTFSIEMETLNKLSEMSEDRSVPISALIDLFVLKEYHKYQQQKELVSTVE